MLLQEVKDYLKITWDDEDGDLSRLILRGKAHLNGIVGVELDFEIEDQPKSLLLDYCRYGYNNALEYFEENFKTQILRLQLQKAVDDYVENQS